MNGESARKAEKMKVDSTTNKFSYSAMMDADDDILSMAGVGLGLGGDDSSQHSGTRVERKVSKGHTWKRLVHVIACILCRQRFIVNWGNVRIHYFCLHYRVTSQLWKSVVGRGSTIASMNSRTFFWKR